MPIRRIRALLWLNRSLYHRANSLFGCQRNQRQACSTIKYRTRRLPALLQV
jgi:hypothetical protein